MKAYVFWHWKQRDVPKSDYENRLIQFHRALGKTSDVLKLSWCSSFRGAPWANNNGAAYEDWYLVENSAALDPLNDDAISESRKLPHDQAAMAVEDGTAGLCYLRSGKACVSPAFALWFSKPKGWSYKDLDEALIPYMVGDVALWARQMALGPGREFCLHASENKELPDGIEVLPISLQRVFPEGA